MKNLLKFLFNGHIRPQKPNVYKNVRHAVYVRQGKKMVRDFEPQMLIDPSLDSRDMSLQSIIDAGIPLKEVNPAFIRSDINTLSFIGEAVLNTPTFELFKDEDAVNKDAALSVSSPSVESSKTE